MGFHNLNHFNIVLLAKQGCRLLRNPNSLLGRTLKAKYFKESDFLNSRLGNLPSFTWQSIWAAKGLLLKGLGWGISNGKHVSIWEDAWIPSRSRKWSKFYAFLCLCMSMRTLLFGGVSRLENIRCRVGINFSYTMIRMTYRQITNNFTKSYGT